MEDRQGERNSQYLRGIVDMGSNGIRFSVTTLQPPTARIMPTLYQSRAAISLYDAQYSRSGERQPIDQSTITKVIAALRMFKRTCSDFDVPSENITILATEATRTAINSEDFRLQIKDHTGWTVTMLPKAEEGRVGAMGIASSLTTAAGLVMDLGGGSTQLSWLLKQDDMSEIRVPPSGAVSMPYGAAALSRRLADAQAHGTVQALRDELKEAIKTAFDALQIPEDLAKVAIKGGGYSLYLSGGGFRGWGYILMSRHRVQPYPIPVINGFSATRHDFEATELVRSAAAASLDDPAGDGIFRISERRATQVPAVALLVTALDEALQIQDIRFCQGGVREGYLYSSLQPGIRSQSALLVASQPFADTQSSKRLLEMLQTAMPDLSQYQAVASTFNTTMLEAFANLLYYYASHSKDIQAAAALRSTTTGVLAATHGVLHEARAVLALLLCARWGGEVSPTDAQFKSSLEDLIDNALILWWINYLGVIASVIATFHPAGIHSTPRLSFKTAWTEDSKGRQQINLRVFVKDELDLQELAEYQEQIEKVGKPKRWIGGKDGTGHKISVYVEIGDHDEKL